MWLINVLLNLKKELGQFEIFIYIEYVTGKHYVACMCVINIATFDKILK